MSKIRGADLIAAKQKTQKKLIKESDKSIFMKETKDLSKGADTEVDVLQTYDTSQVLKVRDSSIVLAAMRMYRRSKELMTMSLDEVADSEDVKVDWENYKVIKVAKQKNAKTGNPAPIVYSSRIQGTERVHKAFEGKTGSNH